MHWIDRFVERTSTLPSPEIMRRWAAISAVAGVMERKVWIRPYGLQTFPNLYIILVGPPGVGKTVPLSAVDNLWRGISDLHVSATSLTNAALVDSLADAKRKVVSFNCNPAYLEFNSLLVASRELSVLIPSWDNEFMNSLTDIYDCQIYDEKRRGGNRRVIIEKPQLNIIGATTPSYLSGIMPQGAWDQGFISRVILVFSTERGMVDLFPEQEAALDLDDLAAGLAQIYALQGEMAWEDDALALIRKWHLDGNPPAPTHVKLTSYCSRRSIHALKLSMVAAAARSTSMKISIEDVKTALRWLIDVETYMPQIFTSFGAGGDETVMADTIEFIKTREKRLGGPVPEHEVIRFIGHRIKSHSVMTVIALMIKSHRVEQKSGNGEIHYQVRAP